MRYRRYRIGQEEELPPVDDMNEIISLFHHIHHEEGEHEVHHCGGDHVEVDPAVDYNIEHCGCGKHAIDKQTAIGHDTTDGFELVEVEIEFAEECPDGGWHIESGVESPETIHESAYKRAPQRHGVVGRCVGNRRKTAVTIDKLHVKELMGEKVEEFFEHLATALGVGEEKELPADWHNLYEDTLQNMEDLVNEWVDWQLKG